MLVRSQPLLRPVPATLWDDIHAAQALLSAVGVAQCKPYLPLAPPTP